MKRIAIFLAVLAMLLPLWMAAQTSAPSPQRASFRVVDEVTEHEVPRLGVNLGSRSNWGAEQLMANVLVNPGFEPTLDGAIVIVKQVSGAEFTDDTGWLGRPDHFWARASFSIRTGRLAGIEGVILDSNTWQGLPHFTSSHVLIGLAAGDVIALRQTQRDALPAHWWWEHATRDRIGVDRAIRPGSPGMQSLRLAPDSAERVAALSYIDLIGDRAGKLLPLSGLWEARFWAKADAGARLTVHLRRLNRPAMLRQAVSPGPKWREYRFRFSPDDSGPPANLEFRFEVEGAGSKLWLDDVSLSPVNPHASGFRREVVETLQLLQPGYLRDWQGQLGDSFANRIADDEARRPSRYRPGDETQFAYSLPQFFALCQAVRAEPWLVLPTTLRDAEWLQAGRYLHQAAKQYGFREIVVEFGNENWNAIFRPAGIMSAGAMAEAAQRGFRLLNSAAAGGPRLLPVLGGQFVNPDALQQAAPAASQASLLAIAPYYAFALPAAARVEDNIPLLFPDDRQLLGRWSRLSQDSRKQLAVYEVNAHSTSGDALPEDVSRLVASRAAGTALLYRALAAAAAGAWRQCLYSFAGFDTFRGDHQLVRLFGITRDLSTVGRLRPTGLAMRLANLALRGDAYRVIADPAANGSGEIGVAVFQANGRWSLLAASASRKEIEISVQLPPAGVPPNTLVSIEGASPLANNEITEQVRLQSRPLAPEGTSVRFRLAPYGASAAIFQDATDRQRRP